MFCFDGQMIPSPQVRKRVGDTRFPGLGPRHSAAIPSAGDRLGSRGVRLAVIFMVSLCQMTRTYLTNKQTNKRYLRVLPATGKLKVPFKS